MNNNWMIKLTVENHPGVMSHITGLFARRAFNLEGIFCRRIGNGGQSRMFLLVNRQDKMEQIIKQLEKLQDVLEVSLETEADPKVFDRVDAFF
jgi:acetolactate synthase-1/3 small subunit